MNSLRVDPEVAVLCEYLNVDEYQCQYQYIGKDGKWINDHTVTNHRVTKYSRPIEKSIEGVPNNEKLRSIMQTCRRAYPTYQVTNVVKADRIVELGNWCELKTSECKRKQWVHIYRCLETPFQSDALLVPENCIFDHVHNQSRCTTQEEWSATAFNFCYDRFKEVHSLAMLLPCGLSLFSGVEFVCCPYPQDPLFKRDFKSASRTVAYNSQVDSLSTTSTAEPNAEEDDDGVNDYGNSALDEDVINQANADLGEDSSKKRHQDQREEQQQQDEQRQPSQEVPKTSATLNTPVITTTVKENSTTDKTPLLSGDSAITGDMTAVNFYFAHFNPPDEHRNYKKARKQLQEHHREKVTKVMKDWADLEDRYQEMRSKDMDEAEEFKQRMTVKFQQSVQQLEEEEKAGIQKLIGTHQQRISAYIQQQKKDAMNCFTRSFNENPPTPHRVQKCLQRLLRALFKDRHHTITHYRHLLATTPEQAEREKVVTLEHLADISNMMNQSLAMLDRHPEVFGEVRRVVTNYMDVLKTRDGMEMPGEAQTITEMSPINKYKAEVDEIQQEKLQDRFPETTDKPAQVQKQQLKDGYDEANDNKVLTTPLAATVQQLSVETTKYENPIAGAGTTAAATGIMTTIPTGGTTAAATAAAVPSSQLVFYDSMLPPAAAAEHKDVQPRVAHSLVHDFVHNEPVYSFKDELYAGNPRSLQFTIAFALFTLMSVAVIGIAVVRRRNFRSPQNQGFVEVDQGVTSEERHVANMQINGYENPTYKYFDIKE